ncbi:hypothetical protein F5Y07DRAFT_279163 [Xylaria sp. FL0933]|nr:hypothetical protein F5Y07DRAFT_279163 [Xylaria sp. FL0933]
MAVSGNPEFHIREDGVQLHTSNTSQLKPSKSLARPRIPSILKPGAWTQSTGNEYCAAKAPGNVRGQDTVHNNQQQSATVSASQSEGVSDYGNECTAKHEKPYIGFKPQDPSYIETGARSNDASRPISPYMPYLPQTAGPSQRPGEHTSLASAAPCESPDNYYGDRPVKKDDKRSIRDNAAYTSVSQPTTAPVPREGAQSAPPIKLIPRKPLPVMRVDGVDFVMVSTEAARPISPHPTHPTRVSALTSTSTPAATPVPAPVSLSDRSRCRDRPISVMSTASQSRSRSPSPAYGAWNSEQPRQRRPSFLERAQERLEHSFNDQLVKARLRPLPSFKVKKVEKPIPGKIPGDRGDGVQNPITLNIMATSASSIIQAPSTIPRARRTKSTEKWDISSDSEAELEAEAERLRRAWKPLPPTPVSTSPDKRDPALHIDTNFVGGSLPGKFIAYQPPKKQAHNSHTALHGPLKPSALASEETCDVSRSLSQRSSDESLFLGNDKGGMNFAAGDSFFSSEYAQAQREHAAKKQQEVSSLPQESFRDRVSASLKQPDRVVETSRRFSWEDDQDSVEAVGRSLPLNDRYSLPSQTSQDDPARKRTLSRKKGMQLR